MADQTVLFSPGIVDDVLIKAREQITRWHESQQHALDGQVVPDSIGHACDVTLSHMGLTSLPPELIDVVKNEMHRMALDNNRLVGLSGLSMRISECWKLRYLVIRHNQLREFPREILEIPNLELLDLKGNKLTSLPEDLSRLSKMRVFSVVRNRITAIPQCLAHMNTLVHLRARDNPITFPDPQGWLVEGGDLKTRDKTVTDEIIAQETRNIKAALVAYANRERLKVQDESDMSEENVETPRPARRKTSGRFPIKPSASATDLKTESSLLSPPLLSPAFAPPPSQIKPPVMSLRTARLPNQPQTATIRPSVAPLVTLSERNRSNSESQMSTTLRSKRMGVTRKPVAQKSADLDQENQQSHLRGKSHGPVLQNGMNGVVSHETTISPVEGDRTATFVHRLSTLPEDKRKSLMQDPIVDLARGVVYALEQLSLPLKYLVPSLKDSKRSNLERTFQVGLSYLEDLDKILSSIGKHDEDAEDADKSKPSMAIRASCQSCVTVFEQLLGGVQLEVRNLISQTNPQRIRTLMHMLYAGLVEVRNACSKLGVEVQPSSKQVQRDVSRGRYVSPTSSRPPTSMRMREQTQNMVASRSSSRARHVPFPSTQASMPFTAASRSGSMVSLNSALMSNGPAPFTSFSPAVSTTGAVTRMSRSNTLMSVDESDEEAQFENIYLKLSAACDFAVQALPRCQVLVADSLRLAAERGSGEADISTYTAIGERCRMVVEAADALRKRLSTLRLKEPSVRSNLEFWQLCTTFIRVYFLFAGRVKECYSAPVSLLPEDIKLLLKPLQRSVKDVSTAISDSIWGALAATATPLPSVKSMTNMSSLNSAPPESNGHVQQARGLSNHSRNQTLAQQQRHPQLSLSTRGMSVPPPGPHDPSSAVSTHSISDLAPFAQSHGLVTVNGNINPGNGNGLLLTPASSFTAAAPTSQTPNTVLTSGYVTPLPATPMSAALGPAAGATVPLPVSVPLSNLAAGGNGGGALGGMLPSTNPGVGGGMLPSHGGVASGGIGLSAGGYHANGQIHNMTNMNVNGASASGMNGTNNINHASAAQAMVAGLQGYLNGAGAASGLPPPPPHLQMQVPMVNGVGGATALNMNQNVNGGHATGPPILQLQPSLQVQGQVQGQGALGPPPPPLLSPVSFIAGVNGGLAGGGGMGGVGGASMVNGANLVGSSLNGLGLGAGVAAGVGVAAGAAAVVPLERTRSMSQRR